ncbi:amino-acid transporter [Neisseria gonorrhoeae]|uniref:Amino-acid transporter n=1 Tax=Neisseria gonorrhoeae TaxID=485 RepID=A0A379B0M0_NEIGO|nr:amino-acid transporter [Neisseria gonorrhoeae]
MLMLLVGTGIVLTVMLKGLQFTMLGYALKQAFVPSKKYEGGAGHEGDISHFAALMTALSATIGTGNIAGVATAVVTGGPGAVFWMWMTAIFGMATKYGEGVLAVKYRVNNSKGEMSGGPMYYIEKAWAKTGNGWPLHLRCSAHSLPSVSAARCSPTRLHRLCKPASVSNLPIPALR